MWDSQPLFDIPYSILMKTLFFFIVFLFFNIKFVNAQELSQHQWKNRIILLLTDSFENDSLRQQKEFLSKFSKELKERKLIQYEISPYYYRFGTNTDHIELGTSTLFQKYNPTNEPFKIVLIGLDGGVKLEKNIAIDPSQIFELIDQMPMRQNELRND